MKINIMNLLKDYKTFDNILKFVEKITPVKKYEVKVEANKLPSLIEAMIRLKRNVEMLEYTIKEVSESFDKINKCLTKEEGGLIDGYHN